MPWRQQAALLSCAAARTGRTDCSVMALTASVAVAVSGPRRPPPAPRPGSPSWPWQPSRTLLSLLRRRPQQPGRTTPPPSPPRTRTCRSSVRPARRPSTSWAPCARVTASPSTAATSPSPTSRSLHSASANRTTNLPNPSTHPPPSPSSPAPTKTPIIPPDADQTRLRRTQRQRCLPLLRRQHPHRTHGGHRRLPQGSSGHRRGFASQPELTHAHRRPGGVIAAVGCPRSVTPQQPFLTGRRRKEQARRTFRATAH